MPSKNLYNQCDLLKYLSISTNTKIHVFLEGKIDLTLCSKCQIDIEDFANFYGLLRKLRLSVCQLGAMTMTVQIY